jgi:hypothetical protein
MRGVYRPPCMIRRAWVMRYNLTERQAKDMSESLMLQLSQCKGDSQRRLILGISK